MNMKLIVGLGNPEKEYANTRHNIGFQIVEYINKEYGGGIFTLDKKTNSEISEVKIGGKKVLLAKPETFVNKSGEAVKKIAASYKLKPDSLIVVHDDLDIPFAKTKISFGRSSAGHKGVESVIRALKTNKFNRLRIGTFNQQIVKIRKIKDKRKRLAEMNKFVISPFGGDEKHKLVKIIKEAAQKILLITSDRL
ncbi:MAG: peptidyl-tRNA hydrolase, PTH1 family [Parcubacteria group bacterium Gr01-1014_2]|nr:MAG: peptidyl-tRNA hydrolase, PTH1 family [Parcubacteria group bacterium Gr01-1014_2]